MDYASYTAFRTELVEVMRVVSYLAAVNIFIDDILYNRVYLLSVLLFLPYLYAGYAGLNFVTIIQGIALFYCCYHKMIAVADVVACLFLLLDGSVYAKLLLFLSLIITHGICFCLESDFAPLLSGIAGAWMFLMPFREIL